MNAPSDNDGPDELQRFLTWAHSGSNVFLTGQAGTGKSTILRQFITEAKALGRQLAVTGSTGIAALNLGGITVHRWAGIQLGPASNEDFEEAAYRLEEGFGHTKARRRVRQAETLILDEISMFPGRHLDFLDFWLRRQREFDKPFGGLQIILCGDFSQLPPVRKTESKPYDWAFTSKIWRAGFLNLSLNLEVIRRQDDPDFTYALSEVRIGNLRGRAADILRPRVKEHPPNNRPRLLTHNAQVDKWCDYQLSKLETRAFPLNAITTGADFEVASLTKHILAPNPLVLKKGCRVMHLVNRDIETSYFSVFVANGQMGTVTGLGAQPDSDDVNEADGDPNLIWVEFDHYKGTPLPVQRFQWKWGGIDAGPTYTQFPLRLAYAITIHKAQGLTLEEAHIDINAAREPGQAYVALSRVRTLAGLTLKEWPRYIFMSDEAARFHRSITRPPMEHTVKGAVLEAGDDPIPGLEPETPEASASTAEPEAEEVRDLFAGEAPKPAAAVETFDY